MLSDNNDGDALPMLFIPKVEQSIRCEKLLEKEYAIYIHIPFCEKRCHFCSIPVTQFTNEAVMDDYLKALLFELRSKDNTLKSNVLKGIHIGGGTPSVLSAVQIERFFDALINQFGDKLPEIVFEANPASLTKDKIDVLSCYHNVTLNFGIQTFNTQRLREINRFDDVEWIMDCLQYAVAKRNLHVGIDLIVGLPNTTIFDFEADLNIVNGLDIKNVFVYPYRLEQKSFFYTNNNGKLYVSQNDMIKYMEYAERKMQSSGFAAKSIYYWTREDKPLYLYTAHQISGNEWIGIGAGAYSYIGNSVTCNDVGEQKYMKFSTCNEKGQILKQNITSQLIWDISFLIKESVFDTKRIIKKYGKIAELYTQQIIEKLYENGYCRISGNKVFLTTKGKVLLDNVEKIIQEVVLS